MFCPWSSLILAGHQVPTKPRYHSAFQQHRGEKDKMEKNL